MTSIAQRERAALADLLDSVGPDAPTLCEGWTTRDLAAHLVSRERRADAALGIPGGPLAEHSESVRRSYAARPYTELVARVRARAPRWSAFGWEPVDRLLNTTEYTVHHEDVRRAPPQWAPRELPAKVQDGLWRAVKGRSALTFRGTAYGVTLVRPSGESHVAAKGEDGGPVAVVTGEALELLLFLFGRGSHAHVDITGPPDAVEAVRHASLGA